ncbi:MAG: zinc finger domain-containing protein [Candidatus Thermoplasmatota archaeon]|nr:zinc finger domain-containing protein [Candidatus Thermoplasmatota archaeon]
MAFERPGNCSSCGKPITGVVKGVASFKCPQCNNTIIARCFKCREQSVLYTCKECGFVGP